MQGNVFSVLFLEGRTLIPKCENFLEKEKKNILKHVCKYVKMLGVYCPLVHIKIIVIIDQ